MEEEKNIPPYSLELLKQFPLTETFIPPSSSEQQKERKAPVCVPEISQSRKLIYA